MSKKILVFTKKVLPRSNTFVATQALNLPTISPVFIGFKKDNTGIELIGNHQTCVLADHSRFPVIHKLLLESLGYFSNSWKKALKTTQAQLIHAHFGKGGFYCSILAKELNLPLVTTFHGSDITQNDKFSYGQRHREIAFKSSAKVIAVSEFIKAKLIKKGCPKEKIIQHYIGIDNDFFKPSGTKSTVPTILFVGRLIEQKGCQFLLTAMAEINKQVPNAQLLIAGYGNYQEKLEATAAKLKNIKFLGAQTREEVKGLMDQAWVTCLPSIVMARGNEEGLPTVCMESQAMGTPVVGFETGGTPEVVINEKTGLLCKEKDTATLTKNLLRLLTSNNLRERYAQNGIDHVNETFNAQKQCQRLEKIYLDLI